MKALIVLFVLLLTIVLCKLRTIVKTIVRMLIAIVMKSVIALTYIKVHIDAELIYIKCHYFIRGMQRCDKNPRYQL